MQYTLKKTKVFKMITQLIPLDPKLLKIRSKVELFKGIDKNTFTAVVGVHQKSRVLLKDVAKFEEMVLKMQHYYGHAFQAKKIIIEAPLCSKAKKAMQENHWEVVDAAL